MISPFPELFAFGWFAPTIIRLVLGIFFVRFGILKLRSEKSEKLTFFELAGFPRAHMFLLISAWVEIIGGLMLIAGLYTQIAAIILSMFMFGAVFIKWRKPELLKNDAEFYVLLLAATATLIISGAGAFAFDIPL